jgi:hypothetical protein
VHNTRFFRTGEASGIPLGWITFTPFSDTSHRAPDWKGMAEYVLIGQFDSDLGRNIRHR